MENFSILFTYDWCFSPTKNRQGISKSTYDIKQIIIVKSDLFAYPVIALSDLHCQTSTVVKMLDEYLRLDEFVILTAGDLAGQSIRGTDGNPTPEYVFLNNKAKEFYFIQGNHDLPDENNVHINLINKQGNHAMIKNGVCIKSSIGCIGGVNGIISDKNHPYKMSKERYCEYLINTLNRKPKILMTHDTPVIPKFSTSGEKYKGNKDIFLIVDKKKPKIHFYGHCHHSQIYHLIGGVNYINLDGRVLIFVCNNQQLTSLLKKPFENFKYDDETCS